MDRVESYAYHGANPHANHSKHDSMAS